MGAAASSSGGCPQCPPPETRDHNDGNFYPPPSANIEASGFRWDVAPPQPAGASEDQEEADPGSMSLASGGSCSSCCSCCKSSIASRAATRCGCCERYGHNKSCKGVRKGCGSRQGSAFGCAFPFDQRPELTPLRKHFLSPHYTHGRDMDCDGTGYMEGSWEGTIPVYEHPDLDIRVWTEAVQLVPPDTADVEVFFHYTSEQLFRTVAGAPAITAEHWQGLLDSGEHGFSIPGCSLPPDVPDDGRVSIEPSDTSDGSDDVKEVTIKNRGALAAETAPKRLASGAEEVAAAVEQVPEERQKRQQQQEQEQQQQQQKQQQQRQQQQQQQQHAIRGLLVTTCEPGQWEARGAGPGAAPGSGRNWQDGDLPSPLPADARFCIPILAPRSLALCGTKLARSDGEEVKPQRSLGDFWWLLRSPDPGRQLQAATQRREQRLRRALSHAEAASEATGLQASPALLGRMLSLGALLEATKRTSEAESLYLRMIQGDQPLGPENMAKIFKALNRLTALYQGSQRLEEAEELHRHMLDSCERHLGKEHPDTLTITYNLAQLLRAQGLDGQAEPLLRTVFAKREELFGPDHPSVVSCVHRLADVLLALHRHAEAEQLYSRAQTWYDHFQGEGHAEKQSLLNSLASLLQSQGRHREAEPLLRRVLAWREGKFGSLHLTTLASKNNLAFLLHSLGSLEEAERLYRHCWQAYLEQVGPNHANTLTTVHNLAQLVYQCDRLEESEPLCRAAFEGSLREGGLEHGSTLKAAARLASVLQRLDKFEEAREILTQVLPFFGIEPGVADDLDTLAVASQLAAVLVKQGEYKEAETILRKVLLGRRLHLGTTHPDIAETLKDLAETLQLAGRLKDAAFFFQEALDQTEILAGSESEESLHLVGRLAHILTLQKNHEEAEWYYLRELKWREHRLFEADCSDTYPVLMALAQGAKAMGKLSQAQDYCRWALRVSDLRLGVDDPTSLQCCSSLAGLLHTDGKLEDAEVLYRRAWEGRSRTYGAQDIRTVGSARKLAYCLQDQGKMEEVAQLCEEVLEELQETLLVGSSQVSDQDDEVRAVGASLLLLLHASKGSSTRLENQAPGIFPNQGQGPPLEGPMLKSAVASSSGADAGSGADTGADGGQGREKEEAEEEDEDEEQQQGGRKSRKSGTNMNTNTDTNSNTKKDDDEDNTSSTMPMAAGAGTPTEGVSPDAPNSPNVLDAPNVPTINHPSPAQGTERRPNDGTPRDHSPKPISASTGECPEQFSVGEGEDSQRKGDPPEARTTGVAVGTQGSRHGGCWHQLGKVASNCCASSR